MPILQLKDTSGNVLEEKELVLEPIDVLIMEYDPDKMTTADAFESFEIVNNALESNALVLAIPNHVQLKVLSIKGEEAHDKI